MDNRNNARERLQLLGAGRYMMVRRPAEEVEEDLRLIKEACHRVEERTAKIVTKKSEDDHERV